MALIIINFRKKIRMYFSFTIIPSNTYDDNPFTRVIYGDEIDKISDSLTTYIGKGRFIWQNSVYHKT